MNITETKKHPAFLTSAAPSDETELSPYSLKAGENNSDSYYAKIKSFADEWNLSLHPWLDGRIQLLQAYRLSRGLPLRDFDELAFELLALGVMLREHADQAVFMPAGVIRLLEKLLELQERETLPEAQIKGLRGMISGIYLKSPKKIAFYTPETVRKLVRWLNVQGAEMQARRFVEWFDYFEYAGTQVSKDLLETSQKMVNQFAYEAERALGNFTQETNLFAKEKYGHARWRYDAMMLTASNLEYHLGMLGTEILNRAYRSAYQTSRNHLLILPPCLCARPEGVCQARQTSLGAVCSACSSDCQVKKITEMAGAQGVGVVMVPDDQLSSLCLNSGQVGSGLGVVGVACALRNWCAGWEAEHLGLHAQGVLLDCAGCEKHWRSERRLSEININQLMQNL